MTIDNEAAVVRGLDALDNAGDGLVCVTETCLAADLYTSGRLHRNGGHGASLPLNAGSPASGLALAGRVSEPRAHSPCYWTG